MNGAGVSLQFFGGEFNREYYEALAVSKIPLVVLRDEPSLFAKKWFDYRQFHPTKSTYLLAHCYTKAYQRFLAQAVEIKQSYSKGFTGKDVMEAREKLSFWKLRMKCDDYGVRYDFACRFAMEWCLARGWKRPPRPNQLLEKAEFWTDMADAWARESRGIFQYATNQRYEANQFIGAPDQVIYENEVVSMVKRSRVREIALHTVLYLKNALRIERAITEFGTDAVSRAIQFA